MYEAINQAVLTLVPQTTKRVLDLGCGTGTLGRAIKAAYSCHVTGLTHDSEEAAKAKSCLDRVIVCDINESLSPPAELFDCIICSHVLEHLHSPQKVLQQLRNCFTGDGKLIVALPNVLFWRQRLDFLFGRFRYTDGGLMDKTHVRFYDWKTAHDLIIDSGYEIEVSFADGNLPLSRHTAAVGRWLDRVVLKRFPGEFGWQFVFRCVPAL